MNIVLANINPAYDELEVFLRSQFGDRLTVVKSKVALNYEALKRLNPSYIFFPHWSEIIPKEIYSTFNCVVFHMTDLPYGRGGSPLQNLIVRGHKSTRLSAIKVAEGMDTGDVYLKRNLDLSGTATEIFVRAGELMKEMIVEIASNHPQPQRQEGEVVVFKRRKADDSNVAALDQLETLYDYIRMLDADGYPKAFVETEHFRVEFSSANFDTKDILNAHVRIVKK